MNNRYCNFVRSSSPTDSANTTRPLLSGAEARNIYLEEIKDAGNRIRSKGCTRSETETQNKISTLDFTRKDLFMCVENNEIRMLNSILDSCPSMIHITDDYGWTLLMIACQANSADAAKELLKRGIDISVRDKAGNSALSLLIKNRNLILADILLSYKSIQTIPAHKNDKNPANKVKKTNLKRLQRYLCEICNKEFPDKEEHLSSTVHNISASKDKKIPSQYGIPASNKGYQLMLKVGWDRESGLGPDGSGKKYPIKTVQKQDRKGLGLDKRKIKQQKEVTETEKHVNRKLLDREYRNSKSMEINFRREFY